MIAVAKITAKGRTTIPQAIREALHVHAGDTIAWEVSRDGVASVRRIESLDVDFLRALEGTLCEWSSIEDEASAWKMMKKILPGEAQ